MRTPIRQPARDPLPRPLFAVRYVDLRGDTVTALYHFRPAAERFAQRVRDKGGCPRVFVLDRPEWRSL